VGAQGPSRPARARPTRIRYSSLSCQTVSVQSSTTCCGKGIFHRTPANRRKPSKKQCRKYLKPAHAPRQWWLNCSSPLQPCKELFYTHAGTCLSPACSVRNDFDSLGMETKILPPSKYQRTSSSLPARSPQGPPHRINQKFKLQSSSI
jgi:hypothetical protein